MLDCSDIILQRGNFTLSCSLHVQEGKLVTLLGSSGAGKSSLLQCIAGFLTPQSGRVIFRGQDITNIAAEKRNACMVFQDYALFPHMTVSANIAYGLRMRGKTEKQQNIRVQAMLELFSLQPYAHASVDKLSGGEQQRVALARALAPEPDILLMDEPLGALDRIQRHYLRKKIRDIQRNNNLSAVYVTHDQEEAFAISDSIALMQKGRIIQYGSPWKLYTQPQSKFAARFLGSCILLEGKALCARKRGKKEEKRIWETGIGSLLVYGGNDNTCRNSAATLCIRPEACNITSSNRKTENCFQATITDYTFCGSHYIVYVHINNFPIPVLLVKKDEPQRGKQVYVRIDPHAIWIIPPLQQSTPRLQ